MSGASADRRPPQVTWGAVLTIGCGVLLVATVFDALAGLHSVDTREQLAKTLSSPEARELGLSVDDATTALHALLLVGGAAAAVSVVLGGYAYLRHTGARAGLAVAAAVALVGSFPADPLLGVLLALGAGLLWSAPARSWFRPERQSTAGGDAVGAPPEEHPAPPGSVPPPYSSQGRPPYPTPPAEDPTRPGPGAAAPPPTYNFGNAPGAGATTIAYAVQPAPQAERHRWRPPAPGSVKAAVALTWTCCALALIGLVAAAAVLANDRARVLELLREQPGYDRFADHEDALLAALWFVDGAFVLWTLAAGVVAVFVLRGHQWARVLLLVSAGVSALVALAAFPASVFHVIGSAVVFALLLSRSAITWFRQRRAVPPATGRHSSTPPDPPRQGPPVW